MFDRTTPGAAVFAQWLLPGERVIWSGRPQSGLMLTQKDAFLIPFSLVWGGFAIFWESTVLTMRQAPIFMAVFGGVFVLIGLFMIAGRFFFDAWVRAGLSYALTDRRILILRSRPSVSFQSVNLDRLPEATLIEPSSGSGTVRFGPAASMWNRSASNGLAMWINSLDSTPQFLAIEDARKVFAAVQKQSRAA